MGEDKGFRLVSKYSKFSLLMNPRERLHALKSNFETGRHDNLISSSAGIYNNLPNYKKMKL